MAEETSRASTNNCSYPYWVNVYKAVWINYPYRVVYVRFIGTHARYDRNCVYEVLAGKRALTLTMIRRLHRELGIPAESLINPSGSRRVA